MRKAFLVVISKAMTFTKHEAVVYADGTQIVEGTFRPTLGTWTGIFESHDGQSYLIENGFVKDVKEVSAS